MLTTSRRVLSRRAMSSLDRSSAASKIILARTTMKYGNVYFWARLVSSSVSARVKEIRNGLFLGIAILPTVRGYSSERRRINRNIRACNYEITHLAKESRHEF